MGQTSSFHFIGDNILQFLRFLYCICLEHTFTTVTPQWDVSMYRLIKIQKAWTSLSHIKWQYSFFLWNKKKEQSNHENDHRPLDKFTISLCTPQWDGVLSSFKNLFSASVLLANYWMVIYIKIYILTSFYSWRVLLLLDWRLYTAFSFFWKGGWINLGGVGRSSLPLTFFISPYLYEYPIY